jgi:hypothetical protein
VEAFKKIGEYKNPQIPITTTVAILFPSEKYSRIGINIVPERKNAVVLAMFLFSILPAIQLAKTPIIPKIA